VKSKFYVLLLTLTLSGCVALPKASDPQRDAALKTFAAPSAATAGIYVYRNEVLGGVYGMDVAVDGQPLGKTLMKTFLYKDVTPGKHTITAKAENTDTLEVDAKAGTLTYIWQEVTFGILTPRNKLQVVAEDVGKKGVMESVLGAAP
jgi:hypothetical protein